jgi:hypothetical protein
MVTLVPYLPGTLLVREPPYPLQAIAGGGVQPQVAGDRGFPSRLGQPPPNAPSATGWVG